MRRNNNFETKLKIIKRIILLKDKSMIEWIHFLLNDDSSKSTSQYNELLIKGNVLWMNFGTNIGNEFSGLHPALILNVHIKSGDVFVLPIDSGHSKPNLEYHIDIPRIYGFKDKPRYVNLYRTQWLSIKRIDFKNRIGHIDRKLLKKISDSIKDFDNNC